MARLRCLTLNTWKNEGDYPRRVAAIAALVRAQAPEVVALQECFVAPSPGLDSAAAVAGGDWHVTRMPARAKRRAHGGAWVESRSDMAILSRGVPIASGTVSFPTEARDGDRGLVWADFEREEGQVRVACTHLTHLQDAAAQAVRAAQAAAAVQLLTSFPGPSVLMGDLNAASDDPALAPIFTDPRLCPASEAFAAPPAGPWPDSGAIDHVLLFAPDRARARMVRRAIVAAPDEHGFPSDHPAILAEIELG